MIKKIAISYLTKRMGGILIICFVLFLLSTLLYAQAPETLWTQIWGGTDDDTGFSVQEISDGGYIIAGYTCSFGAQWYDVYLMKTDENGDTLWTKIFGGEGYDEAQAVLETTNNEYIVAGRTFSYGAGSSDVYLIKTDANGDTLWTRTYGGTLNDEAYSIQHTSDNGYITAGHTRPSACAKSWKLSLSCRNSDDEGKKTKGGKKCIIINIHKQSAVLSNNRKSLSHSDVFNECLTNKKSKGG